MHGFPEYLLTFETGNSCSQLRYSLQIFGPPRAPRGKGPRQCPQDISTSHCVPRVKINPGEGRGERCAAPSSKSENLAWTPSHRYHWHVATPAVSAKKGPTWKKCWFNLLTAPPSEDLLWGKGAMLWAPQTAAPSGNSFIFSLGPQTPKPSFPRTPIPLPPRN